MYEYYSLFSGKNEHKFIKKHYKAETKGTKKLIFNKLAVID